MFRSISETMREPLVINSIALIQKLGLKITRTKVRESFFIKFKNHKGIPVQEYRELLKEFEINTLMARADAAKMLNYTPPFLIFREGIDQDFVLIISCDKTTVTIFDVEEHNLVHLKAVDFVISNNALVILVDHYNKSFMQKKFLHYIKKELSAAENFRKKVILRHNILSKPECLAIIQFCEEKKLFEKSIVSRIDPEGNLWAGFSPVRDSYSAYLANYPACQLILKKIKKAFNIKGHSVETPTCIKYEERQYYKIHHDAADGDQRKSSIFIYLNDSFEGGETTFPEIQLSIVPQSGGGIFFSNLDENLKRIPESLHNSLPVKTGTKYILALFEN